MSLRHSYGKPQRRPPTRLESEPDGLVQDKQPTFPPYGPIFVARPQLEPQSQNLNIMLLIFCCGCTTVAARHGDFYKRCWILSLMGKVGRLVMITDAQSTFFPLGAQTGCASPAGTAKSRNRGNSLPIFQQTTCQTNKHTQTHERTNKQPLCFASEPGQEVESVSMEGLEALKALEEEYSTEVHGKNIDW